MAAVPLVPMPWFSQVAVSFRCGDTGLTVVLSVRDVCVEHWAFPWVSMSFTEVDGVGVDGQVRKLACLPPSVPPFLLT